MSDSYLQSLFAERIGGVNYGKSTAIYKFEKIKRAKAAARKSHPKMPLIDFGVGEPDEMAFPPVVKALQQEVTKSENRGYSDNGGPEFKEAAARYMKRVFSVTLDPQTEILHSIGSKAALSLLPACFINPGDGVIMTTPGYPIFGTHAKYYGGEVYNLPLTAQNNYLPELDSVPAKFLKKAKVLVLNYPNNPTGASATLAFFAHAVAFAEKNNLLIIHDAAYAAITYPGQRPLSILQVPGAKNVALELHSLSKSHNMTGWRIGWVCGNPLAVRAYGDVKDNSDSGQFLAIQKAAVAALDGKAIPATIAEKYERRMNLLAIALEDMGFPVLKPKAGFFLYTRSPQAVVVDGHTISFSNAEDFSQWLIREHLISTVPWDDAGPAVRFSVTFLAPEGALEEERVLTDFRFRLADCKFEF